MPVARTHSVALAGVDGHGVEIEADIENGQPGLCSWSACQTRRCARRKTGSGQRSSAAGSSGHSGGSRSACPRPACPSEATAPISALPSLFSRPRAPSRRPPLRAWPSSVNWASMAGCGRYAESCPQWQPPPSLAPARLPCRRPTQPRRPWSPGGEWSPSRPWQGCWAGCAVARRTQKPARWRSPREASCQMQPGHHGPATVACREISLTYWASPPPHLRPGHGCRQRQPRAGPGARQPRQRRSPDMRVACRKLGASIEYLSGHHAPYGQHPGVFAEELRPLLRDLWR